MRLTRRAILQSGAAALAVPAATSLPALSPAQAQSAAPQTAHAWKHGLSLFGELKYPEDFKRFDYVNAGAPKGACPALHRLWPGSSGPRIAGPSLFTFFIRRK